MQPVIILGMHRSGTTMLIQLLEKLGMFIGKNLDPNCEPIFFMELNDWILKQAGASWDNPEPISSYFYPSSSEVTALTVDYLQTVLRSKQVSRFIGMRRIFQGVTPYNMAGVWGWKDPRNTWTLPLWLKIFPNAKILHIYRHGVDVAASLRYRERDVLAATKTRYIARKKQHIYDFFQKRSGFAWSVRCHDLTSAYELWESYITKALSYEGAIPNQFMNVKYEDFLVNPAEKLGEIAKFCGLVTSPHLIDMVTNDVNASRGLSFMKDKELSEFWSNIKSRNPELLGRIGY